MRAPVGGNHADRCLLFLDCPACGAQRRRGPRDCCVCGTYGKRGVPTGADRARVLRIDHALVELPGLAQSQVSGLQSSRPASALPAQPVSNYGSVTVPAGHYLAKGDNREDSDDPGFSGFVREEFNGRARFVALSLDPARQRLSRPDRWGLALQ